MEKITSEDINLAGKIIVNSMLLALLWAILALPASSFSLIKYNENTQVLSHQDTRLTDETDDTLRTIQLNNGIK